MWHHCHWCLAGTLVPSHAIAVIATEAMKSSIEQVVRVLEDKELKKAERAMERRQQLQTTSTIDSVTRKCPSGHWAHTGTT